MEKEEIKKKINHNKMNTHLKSIFIKPGKLLKEIDKNTYYNFENFEKVKIMNKYNIIGSGAFGDVYQIKSKIDGKIFAMKQMDKNRLISVGIKPEIIYREIHIHIKLVHDHIVRLFSYHEDKNNFYLILEYVEKGTLFSVIQKSQGLSEEDSFKYFIQVASALNFLHDNDLIHRDLKPENCLIDKEGNVKICDFGWTVESNKSRATFCGTYEYMAPEIVKEIPYNNSIDVWSLGVLLYELLHSYSPFRAKSKIIQNYENYDPSVEVLKNIIKFNFKIEKEISEECKDILTKLLNPKCDIRITIRGIFIHPWVINFEERIIAIMNETNLDKSLNNDFTILEPPKLNLPISKINNKLKKEENVYKNNNNNFNKNLPSDELFDSVLDQVQHGKKKHKRKTKSELNYSFSLENIYKSIDDEMKKNKIVVRLEKNNEKIEEKQNSIKNYNNSNNYKNDQTISPIKNFKENDESLFSMYKEMDNFNENKISINSNKFLEGLQTQPTSMIQSQESFMEKHKIQLQKEINNKLQKNVFQNRNDNRGNYNEEIFFNNTKNLRSSNIKYKKNYANHKNLKKKDKDIIQKRNNFDDSILDSIDLYANEKNPFNKKKTEISIQTDTPDPNSFWTKVFGFFNSFKCGGL